MRRPLSIHGPHAERRADARPDRCLRSCAADAGSARLEFMLTVIVVSVLAALALDRVAELQAYAQEAEAATLAAQRRTSEALAQAREGLPHAAAASTPHHRPPAQAPLARAAP